MGEGGVRLGSGHFGILQPLKIIQHPSLTHAFLGFLVLLLQLLLHLLLHLGEHLLLPLGEHEVGRVAPRPRSVRPLLVLFDGRVQWSVVRKNVRVSVSRMEQAFGENNAITK